jgi:hypothetical protein
MTWYDDSNDPQGAPNPGGVPAPQGQPQTPVGPPPAAPPPGVQGDLPTSGGGHNNQRLLIVGGLVIAAVVTLVGAIGAFVLLSGPEELAMDDYAEKMCEEAIEPKNDEIDDLLKTRDFERRIYERDVEDEQEAREAIDQYSQFLDGREQLLLAIESFNSGHQVSGRDGEELRDELTDYVDDMKKNFENAREALDEADPADEEDVFDDIDDASGELNPPSIYRDDRDPGYELQTELSNVDEDCAIFYAE